MKSLRIVVLIPILLLGICASATAGETEETFGRLGVLKVLGDGPNRINLAAGAFDMFDDDDSVVGQIEWRFGKKLGFIGPLAGLLANTEGGVMGYAGIYADLVVGSIIVSPQTGVGAYENGNSNDLGGALEFISGLTLSYQFENRTRLGVRIEHISNANIHETNPGADLLLLNYDIAF